jgi:hypothetical protein
VKLRTFCFSEWVKHEKQFSNASFLACQMLGIIGLQIEKK